MAHYAVVDDFRTGMPQTILASGFRPRGLACHSTEGGEGEDGALGTIQYLISASSRNASYSEVWYPKLDGFEARRIVRPDRAAHSMNPAQPPWGPTTRVRRILGDRWWDPNAYSYAVSIAGTTAGTVPTLVDNPGFMAGATRRTRELLAQFSASLSPDPLYNHGEGQTDRSDWGPFMRPAILAAPEPDVPYQTKPVRQKWSIPAGMVFWVGGPGQGEQKSFTTTEELWSNGESADGTWRRLEYHDAPDLGEEIWARRRAMVSLGERNPATGFGPPTLADCSAQVTAAREATAAKAEAQTQAWVATRAPIVL